jgi:asparagine synthase (glutamine-hydrolysing)
MCGIAGIFETEPRSSAEQLRTTVRAMAERLRHRGPDGTGDWVDAASGIAVGFRRLAILDLSSAGDQPMISSSSRYVLIFNGEIYNHQELRHELNRSGPGAQWRGHSDTEVMLAAFERWGVEAATQRFNGMFAFALWDQKEKSLYLSRDRMGEKPLYYGWMGSTLIFGSELKALRAHSDFSPILDRDALALYLRHNCIPVPYSIYKGILKLPPGTTLKISRGTRSEPVPYWSLMEVVEKGIANPFAATQSETVNALEVLLRDSVRLRMLADVPLGAFLSGGIDSSTVVALMQSQSNRPVKTFSIGSEESGFEEAKDASRVARHLATDHTELYITDKEIERAIYRMPAIYDEPFSDSSQIPTFLVSQLARKHVTVSLSGDGGDEVFGGYNRHSWVNRIWKGIGWMPATARKPIAAAIRMAAPQTWDRLFAKYEHLLPEIFRQRLPGYKMHRLAEMVESDNLQAAYLTLASHWQEPGSVVIRGREPISKITQECNWSAKVSFVERMMYLDTITYLSDDILTKLDRASMSVSLEARVPLLDHRVVEFAWRVPLSLKIREKQGKWILRQLLYKYVPRELVDRPKMGFGIPLDIFLRGHLRDWAENLLSERRLASDGIFNPKPIRDKWEEHLAGRGNWQYHLWDVLMFQSWLDENPGVQC